MRKSKTALLIALACLFTVTAALGASGCKRKKEEAPAPVVEQQAEPTETPIYWPLTGLEAPSEEAIQRRPLSVKIENLRPARPQMGLQKADIVYETVVEGGITRFNAIYQSKLPKEVGPVRSARLSDIYIVPQYNALFAFSGSSSSVNKQLKAHTDDIPNLSQGKASSPYHRVSFRSAPHNLYMYPKDMYKVAVKKSYEVTMTVDPLQFDHSGTSVDTTLTATSIKIPLSTYNTTSWKWNAEKQAYMRYNDGKKFYDAATDKQISSKNVVVMWAKYTPAGTSHNTNTWKIKMDGEGKASVFRDGMRYDGTWSATKTTPPTFKADDGTEILLTPGNTWFEVTPTDVKIKVKGASE